MRKIAISIGILNIIIIACVAVNLNISRHTTTLVIKNIEALAIGEGGGSNHNICYSESVVKVGASYYDCGTCQKVYNEKGKGSYTKCFY